MFIHWFSLLSAVLGVHNLLNNPKFDEETSDTKGGKGPVRSELTWTLWSVRLGSLQELLGGEACWLGLLVNPGFEGGFCHFTKDHWAQTRTEQLIMGALSGSVTSNNQLFCPKHTLLVGPFNQKIKLLIARLHSQHRMQTEFHVLKDVLINCSILDKFLSLFGCLFVSVINGCLSLEFEYPLPPESRKDTLAWICSHRKCQNTVFQSAFHGEVSVH